MVSPIKIYVVDDHDDVRQALVVRLRAAQDILLLGETADAEIAQAEIEALRPDVVLVETKRTDGRGLEIVNWITGSGLGARVAVLTSYPSEWERWMSQRAGVACYLLKDIDSSELIQRLREVASSPTVALANADLHLAGDESAGRP